MRRLAFVAAAVLAAAALAPGSASAGGVAVTVLNRPPAGLHAGDAWTARLRVATCVGMSYDGFTPLVALREQATGRELRVPARRVRSGLYVANVVFPRAGSWTYAGATVGGATFAVYGPVRVAARESGSSIAFAAGGGAIALAAAAAAAVRRLRRAR